MFFLCFFICKLMFLTSMVLTQGVIRRVGYHNRLLRQYCIKHTYTIVH